MKRFTSEIYLESCKSDIYNALSLVATNLFIQFANIKENELFR